MHLQTALDFKADSQNWEFATCISRILRRPRKYGMFRKEMIVCRESQSETEMFWALVS
jgi:hypothetical protein